MSNFKYYKVEEDDELMIKVRKRVPYTEIIRLLLEGNEVFIPCNRKMAYYYKKKFEEKINFKEENTKDDVYIPVECYPAVYKNMDGYLFKISIIRQIVDILSERKQH